MAKQYKLQREPSAAPARKPRARKPARVRKGLLDKGQLAKICILAGEAAAVHGVTGWREVDAWRKAQQLERFGLTSLTAATQDQYADLKAHFLALAGNAGEAYEAARHGLENKRRQAVWNLNKALRDTGLARAYVAAICRTQYRCPLEDASTKQLWALVYTIKARARAKHKKDTTYEPAVGPQISSEIPAASQDADCPF